MSRFFIVQWDLLWTEEFLIDGERNLKQVVRHRGDHLYLPCGVVCDHHGCLEIWLQHRSGRPWTPPNATGARKKRADKISKEKGTESLFCVFTSSMIESFLFVFYRLTEKDPFVLNRDRSTIRSDNKRQKKRPSCPFLFFEKMEESSIEYDLYWNLSKWRGLEEEIEKRKNMMNKVNKFFEICSISSQVTYWNRSAIFGWFVFAGRLASLCRSRRRR